MAEAVEQMSRSLEENTKMAQSVMNDLQTRSKTQVRDAAEQARKTSDSVAQEYKRRCDAAQAELREFKKASDEKIASLHKDMQKLAIVARQLRGRVVHRANKRVVSLPSPTKRRRRFYPLSTCIYVVSFNERRTSSTA